MATTDDDRPNVWISRRWVDGETKAGRPRRKTAKITSIRQVRAADVILVMWSLGRANGERKMRDTGKDGYRQAETFRRDKLAELLDGARVGKEKKTPWATFRKQFEGERLALSGAEAKSAHTVRDYCELLNRVESVLKPKFIEDLDDAALRRFRTNLVTAPSKRARGATAKPATINKSIRYLSSVLSFARKRGFVVGADLVKLRQPAGANVHFPDEDLKAVLEVVDQAKLPVPDEYKPADWWAAFLMIQRSCGLRVGECLDLRWDWLKLDQATLTLPKQKNGSSTTIPLGPQMVELLKTIQDVDPLVFPWPRSRKVLYDQFGDLQRAAGIHLPCYEVAKDPTHKCSPSCHVHGFHALRRSFCNHLAGKVPMQVLKSLARHSSIQTTAKHYLSDDQIRKDTGAIAEPDFSGS